MKVSQNSELIAKRWAKALMELANENQGISKVYILDDLKEVDENINEFHRQAALSDYDWSVEQIDKTLDMWKAFNDASDKDVKAYRDWLLGMKDVENIETRLWGKQIQWKYWKNTRWNCIEL